MVRSSCQCSPPCSARDLSSLKPSARFLAQIGPDLRDVTAEGLARHDLRGARPRQFYIDHAFHPAGAIGHHQDAVGELHRFGDVVGDQQHRLIELLLDLQHLVAEQEPRLLVERRERLVHQQDFRLRRQRARHRHALAHAAGQLGRITLLEAVEPDHGHEMPRPLDALALRHAGDFQREGDIVDDIAPGEGRLFLEHHADRSMRAVDLFAGDRDPAVITAEQAADDVEQGRLAATGRPDHGKELARRDGERHVVERGDAVLGAAEAHDHVRRRRAAQVRCPLAAAA